MLARVGDKLTGWICLTMVSRRGSKDFVSNPLRGPNLKVDPHGLQKPVWAMAQLFSGEPQRNRTSNRLLKRELLYQLS